MKKTTTAKRKTNKRTQLGKRVNAQRDLNIIQSYYSGDSANELADENGITVGRVYQVLYDFRGGRAL